MQEMLDLSAESTNELLRAWQSETYQINDDVGFQLEDPLPENAGGILSGAIGGHLLHQAPGGIGFIWFPLGTRNIDHLVLCPNQTWDKVGSNVSASSNDDNAHSSSPAATCGERRMMSSLQMMFERLLKTSTWSKCKHQLVRSSAS
jgi:hypothetical protein